MSQQLETKQSIKAEKKANQQWTQNPSEFGMRNSECGKNQKSVLIENDSLLSNQHLPNKENQQWNQQELAKLLDIKPIVNSEDESQTAEKNILIPHSEFLIPNSNEEPHKKKTAIPWSENGFAITIVVGLLVAGLFGVGGFLLKTLASSNKEKSLTPIAETKAVPEEELSPDGEDIGWLKTKLALAKQGEQIKAAASQSEPKISLKSSIPRKSEVRSQKSEVNNSEFRIPNSEFKKPPQPTTPRYSPPPPPRRVQVIESPPSPTEQMNKWKTLASIGSKNFPVKLTPNQTTQIAQQPSTQLTAANNNKTHSFPRAIPLDTPNYQPNNNYPQPSSEEVLVASQKLKGITYNSRKRNHLELNRSTYLEEENNILQEVPINKVTVGQYIKGTLSTPLVFAGSKEDYFLVKIQEPLIDKEGKSLLLKGDEVVLKIIDVYSSGLVVSEVTGLIRNGMEYRLPAGVLRIRGKNGNPLIAEQKGDINNEIAKRDASIFALGSLAKVGEILNQPENQTSTFSSGSDFSQSTTSTSRDPNYLGAVLEGGFNPLTEEYLQRNQQQVQELLQRQKLWYVEQGSEVQVFVNKSFELELF